MKESKAPAKQTELPIAVHPDQLSAEAIAGVIESFILREGTDYGLFEVSFDRKAEQIRRQIERGEIRIVFDRISETVSLMTAREFGEVSAGRICR